MRTPNTVTIMSVWPLRMSSTERHHSGHLHYVLPAAKRDKIITRVYNKAWMMAVGIPPGTPQFTETEADTEVGMGYSLMRIYDTFQFNKVWTDEQQNRVVPEPLLAMDNAASLVAEYTNCVVGGIGRPGISIIEGDIPTSEEYATLIGQQQDLTHRLIAEAASLHAAGKLADISDIHRAMATWSGATNLPWIPKFEQTEMKACKACGESIRKVALVCRHCQTQLVDLYRKLISMNAPLNRDEDPVVFDLASSGGGGKRAA